MVSDLSSDNRGGGGSWLVAGGVLAAALVVICRDLLFGDAPVQGDILDQFLPWRIFTSNEISEGRIPLWNPYSFCGAPYLANMQSCVLYPIDRLLDIFFDPLRALSVGVVLHLWLGGLFLTALCRQWGAGMTGATVAALGYVFGGFHAIHLLGGNLLTVTASVYLPLHFLVVTALARRIEAGKPVGWIPFAGSIGAALQVYSGHAQMTFYNALFVTLLALALLSSLSRGRFRFLLNLFLIIAVGGLLAAPQLLATLEYRTFSSRLDALPYNAATEFSLGWEVLPSLVLPEYLGTRADRFTEMRTDTYWGNWKNWSAIYIGILPIAGVIYLLGAGQHRRANRRAIILWGVVLIAGLFLALGRNNPLYALVHQLPLFGGFRAPSKYIPGLIVPLAVLGSIGITLILKCIVSNREQGAKKGIGVALLAAIIGAAGISIVSVVPHLHFADSPKELVTRDAIRSLSFLLVGWGGIVLLSRTLSHQSDRARNFQVGRVAVFILLLACLDIGPYFKKHLVPGSMAGHPLGPIPGDFIKQHLQPGERLLATFDVNHSSDVPNPSYCIPEEIPWVGGYDPLQVGIFVDHFREEGVVAEGVIPDTWSPPIEWAGKLGAGLILTHRDLREWDLEPIARQPFHTGVQGHWFLYRVEDPKPFIEFVPGEPGGHGADDLSADWQNGALQVRGNVPSDGEILIRQTYTPGWKCRSGDGEPSAVRLEKPFWQKVEVSKGEVDCLLSYEPWGWGLGIRLFPIGLLGLIVLGAFSRKGAGRARLPSL